MGNSTIWESDYRNHACDGHSWGSLGGVQPGLYGETLSWMNQTWKGTICALSDVIILYHIWLLNRTTAHGNSPPHGSHSFRASRINWSKPPYRRKSSVCFVEPSLLPLLHAKSTSATTEEFRCFSSPLTGTNAILAFISLARDWQNVGGICYPNPCYAFQKQISTCLRGTSQFCK